MIPPNARATGFQWVVQSIGFWSALAGALAGAVTAFALGAFGKWWAAANAKRAAGNLAIFTLSDMYSEVKAMHEAIFVTQQAELERLLKRKPRYFEYQPVMDLRTQPPSLDLEGLGFLVDSTDPDVLMRLLVARNDFATMLRLAATHERLHLEHQKEIAQSDRRGGIPYRAEEILALSRPDLIAQLEAALESLEFRLQDLVAALPQLLEDLGTVLSYALPTRSFLKFVPGERGRLSQVCAPTVKPALWRRVVRHMRRRWDQRFGKHWPVPTEHEGKIMNNSAAGKKKKFSEKSQVLLCVIAALSGLSSVVIGYMLANIAGPFVRTDAHVNFYHWGISGLLANALFAAFGLLFWFAGSLASRCNRILWEQWFP